MLNDECSCPPSLELRRASREKSRCCDGQNNSIQPQMDADERRWKPAKTTEAPWKLSHQTVGPGGAWRGLAGIISVGVCGKGRFTGGNGKWRGSSRARLARSSRMIRLCSVQGSGDCPQKTQIRGKGRSMNAECRTAESEAGQATPAFFRLFASNYAYLRLFFSGKSMQSQSLVTATRLLQFKTGMVLNKWNFCQTNPIYRKCMDYNNMQPLL